MLYSIQLQNKLLHVSGNDGHTIDDFLAWKKEKEIRPVGENGYLTVMEIKTAIELPLPVDCVIVEFLPVEGETFTYLSWKTSKILKNTIVKVIKNIEKIECYKCETVEI